MEERRSNFGKIFLRSCNLRESFDTKKKNNVELKNNKAMKKVIFTIMLAFFALNVFADNGDVIRLLSDSPTEGLIEGNTNDVEAKVYIFESGSRSINYKYFIRAEIRNDYGIGVEANGETCFKGSKKTIFDDHVVLKIDDYIQPKVYWEVESSVLKIYVTK